MVPTRFTWGIDVAKDSLEPTSWPAQSHQSFINDGTGHDAVVGHVKGLGAAPVVLHATSGYGMAVACALQTADKSGRLTRREVSALVACMRKLLTIPNAMVRNRKPWDDALHSA